MSRAVTVNSDDFTKLIDAALVTATKPGKDTEPALTAIHVDTVVAEARDRAEEQVEDYGVGDVAGKPDMRNYLVATTTDDMIVAGQVSVLADGEFDEPLLLDPSHLSAAKSYVSASVRAGKRLYGSKARFQVELSLVDSTNGGKAILLQTITDGEPRENDSTATINVTDTSAFPFGSVVSMLSGKASLASEQADGGAEPIMGFDPAQIRVMSGIQKVLGNAVFQYLTGDVTAQRILTCDHLWRGRVPGFSDTPTSGTATEPDVPLLVGEVE